MQTLESEEREAVMQIVTSWMLEGIEEGRQEGEVEILLRLLRRRFGEVAIQLEERISQLSIMQLENLAEVLLDFEDERDLYEIHKCLLHINICPMRTTRI